MPTLRALVKPANKVAAAFSFDRRSVSSAGREKYTREVRRVLGPVGEMRVHVDEAGQAGVAGQVEHGHMRQSRIAAARLLLDALDLAVTDHHQRVALRGAGHAVDELAAAHGDRAAVGRVRHLPYVAAGWSGWAAYRRSPRTWSARAAEPVARMIMRAG